MPCAFLIGPLPTAPSQFEVGSSFVTIPDPVHEVAAFFARFDQLRSMTWVLQISGALGLFMQISMASESPKTAFLTW